MIRTIAIGISAVMHPLLMTTYLFALLFFYAPSIIRPLSPTAANYILLALFVTTFVLPIVSIAALRFSAFRITNNFAVLSLPTRQERVLPFFFTSLFYLITTYMFMAKFRVNLVLVVILAAATVLILVVSAATLLVKVSAHAASGGAMAGFLIGLSIRYPQTYLFIPLLVVIVLTGAVMSARLYLDLHSAKGVWLGAGLGVAVSLASMLLFVS